MSGGGKHTNNSTRSKRGKGSTNAMQKLPVRTTVGSSQLLRRSDSLPAQMHGGKRKSGSIWCSELSSSRPASAISQYFVRCREFWLGKYKSGQETSAPNQLHFSAVGKKIARTVFFKRIGICFKRVAGVLDFLRAVAEGLRFRK